MARISSSLSCRGWCSGSGSIIMFWKYPLILHRITCIKVILLETEKQQCMNSETLGIVILRFFQVEYVYDLCTSREISLVVVVEHFQSAWK